MCCTLLCILKRGETRNSTRHRRGVEVDKTNSERKEASQRDGVFGRAGGGGLLLWTTMAHIHILDRPTSFGWPGCLIDLTGTAAGVGIQFWCFSSWRGEGQTLPQKGSSPTHPTLFPLQGSPTCKTWWRIWMAGIQMSSVVMGHPLALVSWWPLTYSEILHSLLLVSSSAGNIRCIITGLLQWPTWQRE